MISKIRIVSVHLIFYPPHNIDANIIQVINLEVLDFWPNAMRIIGRMSCEPLAGYDAIAWPDVMRTRGRMLCDYA